MNIFYNSNEQRLRAGWRLISQFFLMYALGLLLVLVANGVGLAVNAWATTVAMAAGAFISLWMAARGLDRRPWSDYGLQLRSQSAREALIGFSIAAAALGVMLLLGLLTGWIHITSFGWSGANGFYVLQLVAYTGFMIVVGLYEEAIFRGYQITNISEGFNGSYLAAGQAVGAAVIFSSLLFGLMHALNPSASLLSTLNVSVAGAVLALPFVLTGRLWLSVGLHIGWNAVQGGVMGFNVSGIRPWASLLQTDLRGPAWVTGAGFGPEGGLLGFVGLVTAGLLTWYYLQLVHHPAGVHTSLAQYRPGSNHAPLSAANQS